MTGSSCCLKKNTYLNFITRMAKQLLNFLFFKERDFCTVTAISNVQKHMLPESVLL